MEPKLLLFLVVGFFFFCIPEDPKTHSCKENYGATEDKNRTLY